MEINLQTDEKVELVIDGTCEFRVWGERNEEGTMVIKSDADQKETAPKHKEFQKAVDKSGLRGYKLGNTESSEVKDGN